VYLSCWDSASFRAVYNCPVLKGLLIIPVFTQDDISGLPHDNFPYGKAVSGAKDRQGGPANEIFLGVFREVLGT
jgi:hypothetical protein